jgi:hypothetical protein
LLKTVWEIGDEKFTYIELQSFSNDIEQGKEETERNSQEKDAVVELQDSEYHCFVLRPPDHLFHLLSIERLSPFRGIPLKKLLLISARKKALYINWLIEWSYLQSVRLR